MSKRAKVGLIGLGYALPATIRGNDDPLFVRSRSGAVAHGVSEAELFTGLVERCHVSEDETAEDLGARAARMALERAGIAASRVDRLYGCISPSTRLLPNGLFEVHRQLGLPISTLVLPISVEFTTFTLSCSLAAEAIAAGHCEHVLVVCGGAWSRNMDFENPHAWSIGDGAAAAVLGASERMVWLGSRSETYSEAIASMVLPWHGTDASGRATRPTFELNAEGVQAFLGLGVREPPRLLEQLMAEHGVDAARLTLVSHQPSSRLMDVWRERLKPASYLSSLSELGNMTLATVGVNLAREQDSISTDYIGCITLGLGQHISVGLIQR